MPILAAVSELVADYISRLILRDVMSDTEVLTAITAMCAGSIFCLPCCSGDLAPNAWLSLADALCMFAKGRGLPNHTKVNIYPLVFYFTE